MKRLYEEQAKTVADAVRELAAHPEALDNLELYLATHFGEWLDRFARYPDELAAELREFASIHN